jgi:putative phosphonate metabolism protein
VSLPRYALYYAPRAEESLAAAAAQWLGYSPETGQMRAQPSLSEFVSERLAELTAEPRLYGFHGTLKAPFALVDEATERDLLDAAGRFAASRRAVIVPSMALAELGSFLAMVPGDRCGELQDLADNCVIEFDEFRRPANEAELARRRMAALSPRQEELLMRWGYPYVLEQWRFHLTLTGRVVDPHERKALMTALRSRFAAFLDRPLQMRELCVFRQPAQGQPFIVLARFRLGGGRLVAAQVWRAS